MSNELIKPLNKYPDKPWILLMKISINYGIGII